MHPVTAAEDLTNPPSVTLSTPNGAQAEIHAHGAHVTRWLTAQRQQGLFLSQQARFDAKSAIRGGVPVIFPQFNALGKGPKHGFARTSRWRLENGHHPHCCRFHLSHDDTTLAHWPHRFQAQFTVTLTDTSLDMQLDIQNMDTQAFEFTAALHTYLSVQQAHECQLQGLQNVAYWDNDGQPFEQRQRQAEATLTPFGGIDRVYFDCPQSLRLHDANRVFELRQSGFKDCVVWNPGAEGAAALADTADGEHERMLCVEAGHIERAIQLASGAHWHGSQTLSLCGPDS